jgi:hypothetical protein
MIQEDRRSSADLQLVPKRYEAIDRKRVPVQTRRGPRHGRKRRRPRWRLRLIAIVPLLGVCLVAWSLVGAATTPGNESFSAKWADWLRSHRAAFVANATERWYYDLHTPKKGGQPSHLNALPSPSPIVTTPPVPTTEGQRLRHRHRHQDQHRNQHRRWPPHLPSPKAVPLVVSPALPEEGKWQPVGVRIDGIPGMYEAQFRADTIYTSQITSAVWIDPKLLRLALVPGLTEPGGTWPIPPYITPAERRTVEAAFNGGFRIQDAHGGFYLNGRTAVPLVNGAASLVIYKDGLVSVGSWGHEVTMTPSVDAVLQNLVPMVDHGRVSPAATYDDASVWGATLGASTVVARSGVGVTADGGIVYVAGPALTAKTLAEALQRAGALRAMTLDINPEWVTFNFFSHHNPLAPAQLAPASLYPQMQRPDTRYLGPTKESRDFITISLPPGKRR